jgi:ubiquitin thioesterase ZRANB1
LDSALQATWGVVDRDNTLRQTLSDSLSEGDSKFYERWKYTELLNAHKNGFNIEEDQLKSDWSNILSSADRKKQPLEQAHIFVLAHILRRPLIVYAVKVVKNFKGEQLGLANFEGIYLPLLWDSTFCWKVPIALGYTRGHFSALVGMEKPKTKGSHVTYLPLVDNELKQLPVHFLSEQEIDCYEELIKEYCDCHVTSEGVLTARQIVVTQDQPVEMIQLMNEWMNRFFRLNKRQEATCNDINVNT